MYAGVLQPHSPQQRDRLSKMLNNNAAFDVLVQGEIQHLLINRQSCSLGIDQYLLLTHTLGGPGINVHTGQQKIGANDNDSAPIYSLNQNLTKMFCAGDLSFGLYNAG
jgi:hypothetical protein